MNLFNKTLLASSMLAASMSVNASPFYIDLTGTGIGGGIGDATNCANCTSDKNQLGYDYVSSTVINLNVANTITAGDLLTTTGGLDFTNQTTLNTSFDNNNFSGFIPSSQSLGYTNDRFAGLPSAWGLSFVFNLTGEVEAVNGPAIDLKYTGGIFEIYLVTYSGSDVVATNIFDINITGSQNPATPNFLVFGEVGFSGNEPALYQDMFHDALGSCAGDSSFFALANCTPPVEVTARFDQNLDNPNAVFTDGGTIARIGGDHNGSLSFNVPEPSTLMLLGSALLGLSATRRNKA